MIYSVVGLRLGTLRRPDSGFMPLLAATLLSVFSAAWFWANRGKDANPQPLWEKGEWVRPALVVVLLILYGWSMTIIGYMISTLLFLVGWQFLVERERWWRATLVSVLGTAGMYVLFARLLGVAVPPGIFGR